MFFDKRGLPADTCPKARSVGLNYALGQLRTLTVYLADGRVELDDNFTENAIRPTAIGKKN